MIRIDAYELRARFAPSLIVVAPFILVAVALLQAFASTILTASATALVFLALLYAYSFVVRGLGRRIEGNLWNGWGGPPSSTALSDADPLFSAETKSQITTAIAARFGVVCETGWRSNAGQVQEIFRQVRHYIRQHDPNGLWYSHNAEYGFLRNLLGSWWLLLINSILAAGISAIIWKVSGDNISLVLVGLSVIFALFAIVGRIFILPGATRIAAVRYAESAWVSFLGNAATLNESAQRGGVL